MAVFSLKLFFSRQPLYERLEETGFRKKPIYIWFGASDLQLSIPKTPDSRNVDNRKNARDKINLC